jgi:UDP-glucose 4-epimerase
VGRFLVTGGAGFIGSHLVARLVRDGHSVRVVDNFSTGSEGHLAEVRSKIEVVRHDLTQTPLPTDLLDGIEIVFHEAALPSVPVSVRDPLGSHAACATATVNMLDACRRSGVRRLVFAASSSAYGESPELPKRENQLPQTLSPYAAAKLASEMYCQAFASCFDLETVCLRYFNVFGPRQDPSSPYSAVIPLFIQAVLAGRRPMIFGDGQQSRDFVFVEDVVQANLLAATTPGVSGRVYNVGTGRATSLLELLSAICELTGKPYDPNFQPPRVGDVRESWADISKARGELGFAPQVDLMTGLKRTIDAMLPKA